GDRDGHAYGLADLGDEIAYAFETLLGDLRGHERMLHGKPAVLLLDAGGSRDLAGGPRHVEIHFEPGEAGCDAVLQTLAEHFGVVGFGSEEHTSEHQSLTNLV